MMHEFPTAPHVGIDLVEPDRLAEKLKRNPPLLDELFHAGEVAYSRGQPDPGQCLAARLAAKEAVHKCLGMPGLDPLDVEVVGGGPDTAVALHGEVARRASALGVLVTISLTHVRPMAGAIAMARTPG